MLADLTGNSRLAVEFVTAPLLFAILLTVGRLLKRRAGVPLGFFYLLFCVVVAVWAPLEFFHATFPYRENTMRALRTAVVLLGTVFFLALLRRYYWELWFEKYRHTRGPKFLSQLIGLLIFIAAIFVVIGGIYGQSIEGVIFGSTVVVGIVGFAMQDLLGNLIAGVALEVGKPFKPGDWLIVDDIRAEVMEVNWRSTKLRTNDEVYLDIPNKAVVGGRIVNLTYPTRPHASRLLVRFEFRTPPNVVKDLILQAVKEVKGVLDTPAPRVFLKDFGDSAIAYEVKFWLEDEAIFNDINDSIRTHIWYAAQREGLRMPFPTRTLQVEKQGKKRAEKVATARATACQLPLLKLLDEGEQDKLLSGAELQRFGRGERVIRQGDEGQSMFILLSGQADVSVHTGDHETRVATLHPGDHCGEMSMLTGEPRSATVVATEDCELWEIPCSALADLLQGNQVLLGKLGEMLAQRRLETEGVLASEIGKTQMEEKKEAYTDGFMQKLSAFFRL